MNKVLEYFKQISKIPRGSGNEKQVSDFVVAFAKERNLWVFQDKNNNVIIKKEVGSNPLILQAHLDMVCEKSETKDKDFQTEGIDLIIDGNILKADGTTLGADDGMGVALMLAILEEEDTKNIECVFTVAEETTMLGAKTLDYSLLQGVNIIGLDGNEEGSIEVSSAGFCCIRIGIPLANVEHKNKVFVKVGNLKSGHSGEDIDKNRENAIELIARLNKPILFASGGTKMNVIPCSAEAIVDADAQEVACLLENIKNDISQNEPNFYYNVEAVNNVSGLDNTESTKLVEFINKLPKGVLSKTDDYVITSLNIAKIDTTKGYIDLSLRSSKKDEESKFISQIKQLAKDYGYEFSIIDTSPFFEFKENTKLLHILENSYMQLFNKLPKKKRIHAGLEGGVFAEKIESANIYVTAPNMYNLHTTNEYVEIDSIDRTFKWILKVVKEWAR